MHDYLSLNLGGDVVRFTPDGKVAVEDAIRALFGENHPVTVWRHLKRHHPELDSHCQDYSFDDVTTGPVTDGDGWEIIEATLLDYVLDKMTS